MLSDTIVSFTANLQYTLASLCQLIRKILDCVATDREKKLKQKTLTNQPVDMP